MAGYLGNPKLVLLPQDLIPVATYEYNYDPTTSINPPKIPVSWLNTSSGEVFVCIDNTTNNNVWISTSVGKPLYRGAHVYRLSDYTVATSSEIKVPFETVVHDTSGFFDLANYPTRLTVPAAVSKGRLIAGIRWSSDSTGYRYINIYKNNSVILGTPGVIGYPSSEFLIQSFVTPVLNVNTGDYFELNVYHTKGSNATLEGVLGRNLLAIEVIE